MDRKFFVVLAMVTLLSFGSLTFGQEQKDSVTTRWRLKFENEAPQKIVLEDPSGQKHLYWYFRYKIINKTDRDIPNYVNIRAVIDKTAPGVPPSEVPQLFHNAEIPKQVENKEQYLRSLATYYDTDLPIVRKEIMEKLGIYPRLKEKSKAVLQSLEIGKSKTVFEIMREAGLSFAETESILNELTVYNYAISEEVEDNPTYVKGTQEGALFWIDSKKVVKQKGETVHGWKIVGFDDNAVLLSKQGVNTLVGSGSTVEYLYSRTHKAPFEQDVVYTTISRNRGTYKGRGLEEEKKYIFHKNVIPKNSVQHGIAIFANVSPEMDFMGIIVSGLVDPIVQRYKVVYAYNEVYMLGYKKMNAAYAQSEEPLLRLYRRWVVLDKRVIRKNGD